MCKYKKFNFKKEIKKVYLKDCVSNLMKDICKINKSTNKGTPTEETKKIGIYALYLNGELKKIGKASYKNGIYHRMIQYYNLNKTGGLIKFINTKNRDSINVIYCLLDTVIDCWIAERRMQVLANDLGESMPWEDKARN